MNRKVWILVGEHPTLAPDPVSVSVYDHEHIARATIRDLRKLYPDSEWTYRLHLTQVGVIVDG